MDERLHELIAFILEKDVGLTRGKARSLGAHFADLQEFTTIGEEDLANLKSATGKKILSMDSSEIADIVALRNTDILDPGRSVADNFLAAISRDFTRRQVRMIRSLSLERITPNPLLIRSLSLNTPEEVVHMNVYMLVTRSIVTSMGFFVEKLLLASSDSLEIAPRGSGWDMVKVDDREQKHWIQVKSGPSDMDKDQIVYWAKKIEEKTTEGDGAFIGVTYGKRTLETVTIGLMKQILPDWEMKTLFGRELWDFVSDDPTYHTRLFELLRTSALAILKTGSIVKEIESCIERVLKEFTEKYGDGEEGVSKYIDAVF